jgi:hypothetical protein
MDPVISTLFPTYKIGSDGFSWWIGQVENVDDKKGGGRVQVRIVGQHHREGDITPTTDLPWAHVMLPANIPYSTGTSSGASNLKVGCWVVGCYLDVDCQKPLIMGSIAHTPGSTYKEDAEFDPSAVTLGLKRTTDPKVKPTANRSADEQKGRRENGSNADGGPAAVKKLNKTKGVIPMVAALKGEESDTNPTGGKVCVKVADPNCDAKDLGTSIKKVISEILKNSQNSGGNLGSYYVGKVNGELYDAAAIPRKYINKINRIVVSFGTRIKKEIVFNIRSAIESLIKLVMGVEAATEGAKLAADKAKAPDESLEKPKEKGNFIKKAIDVFNQILNELGCSFTKTLDDLIKYIVDLIMEYLLDAFSAAFCLIDNIVTQITKYLNSAFESLINAVLGPLEGLLSGFENFGNIIGGLIKNVLDFLNISCTGLSDKCNKNQTECSDGSSDDKKENDEDFLDRILKEIEGGSLTGNDLSGTNVPRVVCDEAKTNGGRKETSVQVKGGVLNQPIQTSYVSTTTIIPDIPLSLGTFPSGYENLPVANPAGLGYDRDSYTPYKLVASPDKLKLGGIATFDLTGPERNSVLEVEILSSSDIFSEAFAEYEPCLVESGDGLAVGLEIQIRRDAAGVPSAIIVNPGTGYLVGMIFTLPYSKIGGTSGDDDIEIKITKVGQQLTYRMFGDARDKRLIDTNIYDEYRTFTYSEPISFVFPTRIVPDTSSPSIIGLEIIGQRASDSIILWEELPEEIFADTTLIQEEKSVELTTEKDSYVEGSSVTFIVNTIGYPDGSEFTWKISGDVDFTDYIEYDDNVVTNNGSGSFLILLNDDGVSDNSEVMLVVLYDSNDVPVAFKQITILDKDSTGAATGVVQEDTFVLTSTSTQEDLDNYLATVDTSIVRDFGDFTVNLPPDLGAVNIPERSGEPVEFLPPQFGDPIVDSDGSIISIPVTYPGNRSYQIAPKLVITGAGYGASAIPLLDEDGFLTEVRVTKIGVGYVPNIPEENGVNCIIDSFTVIRPGFGYTSSPTIYIDGDPDIAEVVINTDGFITGARVLNRDKSFDTIPEIIITGGGGFGGFVLPSLVCLPPEELRTKGYVKIGTGNYIDCP